MRNDSQRLKKELEELRAKAMEYFRKCMDEIPEDLGNVYLYHSNKNLFWNEVPPDLKDNANSISEEVMSVIHNITSLATKSTLTTDADIKDISTSAKSLYYSLRFVDFTHFDADVAHNDEGVIGFLPQRHEYDHPLKPSDAIKRFNEKIDRILEILSITLNESVYTPSSHIETDSAKYKPDTAFILMWMSPERKDLDDICDAVKEVFGKFGFRARRADDIEHEEKITDRIIQEIKSSELIFADLTGERPNVYYEVGFAYAISKRVLLYRKSGTSIHFDLAGYNCPEYENIRDLKTKLSKRLEEITGKKPASD